jgi:sulfite reductase alpha subunit-like flavoprotein
MPLEILIEMIGRLSPREFSISSSNLTNKSSLEITLGVVEYTTIMGRKKIGVCSEWIKHLHYSLENKKSLCIEDIGFSIKSGNFPKINLEDNLILIATGTGVAPFRSLLWDRYHHIISITFQKLFR